MKTYLNRKNTMSDTKAEEFYLSNYKSEFNCSDKINRKIKQFDINDMIDFASQFSNHQNKALIEDNELLKKGYKQISEFMIKYGNSK